jgi:hypothetical protein
MFLKIAGLGIWGGCTVHAEDTVEYGLVRNAFYTRAKWNY